jgi:copper transport protein
MTAVGLFVLRMLIARPVVRAVPGVSLRGLAIAFWVAIAGALIATPIYLVMSTAKFALRSAFDLGNVLPLLGDSAFGRGYLRLELLLALLAIAGGLAIWLDRPERRQRPTVALLSFGGAVAGAASLLVVQGLSGHAAQTSPRWLTLPLDWVHLAAGSIWVGGLVGLLVLWFSSGAKRVAALAVSVPRFSRVAFCSVIVLVGTGIGAALIQFPTFDSLWDTSYGKSLVLKICFLAGTLAIAFFNLTRTAPALDRVRHGSDSSSSESGSTTARVLRILVSGEVILLVGAVFGASLLTSLPPPPKALANLGEVNARVGPGPARTVLTKNGYRLAFEFTPNRAAVPNTFSVAISKDGKPVRGADVTAKFTMLDMEMGQLAYTLPESTPGVFKRSAPALVMVGHWGIDFDIRPPGGSPLEVLIQDRANG